MYSYWRVLQANSFFAHGIVATITKFMSIKEHHDGSFAMNFMITCEGVFCLSCYPTLWCSYHQNTTVVIYAPAVKKATVSIYVILRRIFQYVYSLVMQYKLSNNLFEFKYLTNHQLNIYGIYGNVCTFPSAPYHRVWTLDLQNSGNVGLFHIFQFLWQIKNTKHSDRSYLDLSTQTNVYGVKLKRRWFLVLKHKAFFDQAQQQQW